MDVAAEERTDPQTEWMLQAVKPFVAQSEAPGSSCPWSLAVQQSRLWGKA